MWSSLSSMASATGIKGKLSALKGQLSELTNEVMSDLEESEAQAHMHVQEYRDRRAREERMKEEAALLQQEQAGLHANGHHTSSSAAFSPPDSNGPQDPLNNSYNAQSAPLYHDNSLVDTSHTHSSSSSSSSFTHEPSFSTESLEYVGAHSGMSHELHEHVPNGFEHSPYNVGSAAGHEGMQAEPLDSHTHDASSQHQHSFDQTPIAHTHTLHTGSNDAVMHETDQPYEHDGSLPIDHTESNITPLDDSLHQQQFHASSMDGPLDRSQIDLSTSADMQSQSLDHDTNTITLTSPQYQQPYGQHHTFEQQQSSQSQSNYPSEMIAHLQALLTQAQMDLSHSTAESRDVHQQLQQSQTRFAEEHARHQQEVNQLQGQHDLAHARLLTEMQSKEEEYDKLQTGYAQLQQEVAAHATDKHASVVPAAPASSADDNERISQLEVELEELRGELESMTDERDTLTEILNELRSESEATQIELKKALHQHNEEANEQRQSSQIAQLQSQLDELQTSNQQLKQQLAAVETSLAESQQSATSASEQHTIGMENLQQQLTAAITALNQSQYDAASAAERNAAQVASLQTALSRAQDDLIAATHLTRAVHSPHAGGMADSSPSSAMPSAPGTPSTPRRSGSTVNLTAVVDPTALSGEAELRAALITTLRQNEKLSSFRSQAIVWKREVQRTVERLKHRKEELQQELKQMHIKHKQEKEQMRMHILQLEHQHSSGSADQTDASASSSELIKQEHAAAMNLLQSQLDLARQQLTMQLDQISVLQQRIHELEVTSTDRNGNDDEQLRIQSEYLRVTDQLRQSLRAAEARVAEQEEHIQLLDAQAADNAHEHELALQSASNNSESFRAQLAKVQEEARNQLHEFETQSQAQMEQLVSEHDQQLSALRLQLQTIQAASSGDQNDYSSALSQLQEREVLLSNEVARLQSERMEVDAAWQSTLEAKTNAWNAQQQEWGQRRDEEQRLTAAQMQQMAMEIEQLKSTAQTSIAAIPSPTATATPSSPISNGTDAALVEQLRAQLATAVSDASAKASSTQQLVQQLNTRYDQLMSSFTSLQQRCRDGLVGEEGNLETIATLEAALLDARATAAETEGSLRQSLETAQQELAAAKAESRKVEQTKNELSIMSMRWRESMSEADGLRKRIRELQENGVRGESDSTVASAGNSTGVDESEQVHLLRQQVQNLKLDMASLESLQSDYAALQRQSSMSAQVLAEVRAQGDEARQALIQTQQQLHAAHAELAAAHSAMAAVQQGGESVSPSQNGSTVGNSSSTSDLHAIIQRQSAQLAEMSAYTTSLEHDNLSLRKTFESKMKSFTTGTVANDENQVDRRLVVKMLVTFFERKDKDEVLNLMARVLHFSPEDQSRIQRGRQGLVGSFLGFLAPEPEAFTPHNDNLADNFIEFLMAETAKGEAKGKNIGGTPVNMSNKVSPGISAVSPASVRLQSTSSTFANESEFESRPTRAPLPTHTQNTTTIPAVPLAAPLAAPIHSPPAAINQPFSIPPPLTNSIIPPSPIQSIDGNPSTAPLPFLVPPPLVVPPPLANTSGPVFTLLPSQPVAH
jgi:DNA repair exonuclease SbcCD ATPase subunit